MSMKTSSCRCSWTARHPMPPTSTASSKRWVWSASWKICPTTSPAVSSSQDVLGLLKVTSQKYGQTIVMITHNEEIAQLADRIIRIEDGKIVERR